MSGQGRVRIYRKPMLRLILFSCFLISVLSISGQNRPLPPNFPLYHFEAAELAYNGHYFSNAYELHPETITNMFILDALGYVAWYRKDQQSTSVDFKYQPAANVFTSVSSNPDDGAIFITYNTDFIPIDTLRAVDGERGNGHDFLVLANGSRLICTNYDTIMDLRNYTFSGTSGSENNRVRGFGIQEFDAENNLVWKWHSTDFVHPAEFSDGLSYLPYNFDYAHGNALQVVEDGNLLVSLRNTSTVYKIDRVSRSGDILWRLGGESSSFTFAHQDDQFSTQHFARFLPNGNIGLYDNGTLGWPIRFSRAVEYELDFMDSIARPAWSYDAGQSVFAASMGNAQWLNDSLILIGWGYVFRPDPTFSLVNRAGDLLAGFYLEDRYMTYRVQAAELPFALPRPALSFEPISGGVEISAPAGYSEYVWSTGDTTMSITVTDNGVYQVWVPHGVGMVGSYPLEVDHITGVGDLTEGTIKVFPNPAAGEFYVELDLGVNKTCTMALFGASGRQVWTSTTSSGQWSGVISVVNFPPGMYYLRVRTPQGVFGKKVILL